jgi:hypothetical protein
MYLLIYVLLIFNSIYNFLKKARQVSQLEYSAVKHIHSVVHAKKINLHLPELWSCSQKMERTV